ncbi:MAG: CsgE family curli-type amyloid fiber assembly protein [Balneolaceae bacterium]
MKIILFSTYLALSNALLPNIDKCSDPDIIYTVNDGDNLFNVAIQFGSNSFWESIYISNADRVNNPHRIYPGQEIRIPYYIARFNNLDISISEVLQNPFCRISELPIEDIDSQYLSMYSVSSLESKAAEERNEKDQESDEVTSAKDDEDLEAFRSAFESVMSEAEEQKQTEKKLMIELDGMIHDETRSKVGKDFYDIFYMYWQSPEEANNFTIHITETPAPSLGTVVSVEVNDSKTFTMKLQPRYEVIEEAGKSAVRATYMYLRDRKQETMIY